MVYLGVPVSSIDRVLSELIGLRELCFCLAGVLQRRRGHQILWQMFQMMGNLFLQQRIVMFQQFQFLRAIFEKRFQFLRIHNFRFDFQFSRFLRFSFRDTAQHVFHSVSESFDQFHFERIRFYGRSVFQSDFLDFLEQLARLRRHKRQRNTFGRSACCSTDSVRVASPVLRTIEIDNGFHVLEVDTTTDTVLFLLIVILLRFSLRFLRFALFVFVALLVFLRALILRIAFLRVVLLVIVLLAALVCCKQIVEHALVELLNDVVARVLRKIAVQHCAFDRESFEEQFQAEAVHNVVHKDNRFALNQAKTKQRIQNQETIFVCSSARAVSARAVWVEAMRLTRRKTR